MQKGVVISDLHMFARRSRADAVMDQLHEAVSRADVLVLNGDIFDFRWSTLTDVNTTVRAATSWLADLAWSYPGCEMHFVAGNHDCHADYLAALDGLARQTPTFSWHEFALVLGDNLFMHGDCLHRPTRPESLMEFRARWGRKKQRGPRSSTVYQWVDQARLPQMAQRMAMPRARSTRRVMSFLVHWNPEIIPAVEHVYFGHTHEPFDEMEYAGLRFHNTGCAVDPRGFNPLHFTVTDNRSPRA